MTLWRARRGDLEEDWARQACALWERVWPQGCSEPLLQRVRGFYEDPWSDSADEVASEVFHLLEEGGRLLAVSRSFHRRIAFVDKARQERVLALASVCSDPDFRGRGFGAEVVRDAFARLEEEGLLWSLFQTGVPAFYRKLGGFPVDNCFVNRLNAENPEARPWWDEHVIVVGSKQEWPEGLVDLRGPGY